MQVEAIGADFYLKAKCLIIHTCRKGQSATGCSVVGSYKDVYSYVYNNIRKAVYNYNVYDIACSERFYFFSR